MVRSYIIRKSQISVRVQFTWRILERPNQPRLPCFVSRPGLSLELNPVPSRIKRWLREPDPMRNPAREAEHSRGSGELG